MKRILMVLAFLASTLTGMAVAAEPAQALNCVGQHSQPNSSVANQCRAQGWTINAYIVVDPTTWVRWYDTYVLIKCNAEYGGPVYPCWWNFREPPNYGSKYWFDYGGNRHNVAGLNLS